MGATFDSHLPSFKGPASNLSPKENNDLHFMGGLQLSDIAFLRYSMDISETLGIIVPHRGQGVIAELVRYVFS